MYRATTRSIQVSVEPVYLADIWPSSKEIAETVRKSVTKAMFKERYGDVFKDDAN